jgi:hypothetical protein
MARRVPKDVYTVEMFPRTGVMRIVAKNARLHAHEMEWEECLGKWNNSVFVDLICTVN